MVVPDRLRRLARGGPRGAARARARHAAAQRGRVRSARRSRSRSPTSGSRWCVGGRGRGRAAAPAPPGVDPARPAGALRALVRRLRPRRTDRLLGLQCCSTSRLTCSTPPARGVASLTRLRARGLVRRRRLLWGRPLLGVALARDPPLDRCAAGAPPRRVLDLPRRRARVLDASLAPTSPPAREPVVESLPARQCHVPAPDRGRALRVGPAGSAEAPLVALAFVARRSRLEPVGPCAPGSASWTSHADNARADLGALEIARAMPSPPRFPARRRGCAGSRSSPDVTAGRYFAVIAAHGSSGLVRPARSPRRAERRAKRPTTCSSPSYRAAPLAACPSHAAARLPAVPRRPRTPAPSSGGAIVTNRGDALLVVGVRAVCASADRPRVAWVCSLRGATARIAIPRDSVDAPLAGHHRAQPLDRLQVCPL